MAKPKVFHFGETEIQYTTIKERNEKVYAIADDVLTRLNDPIVILRVPWKGECDYAGYLILPAHNGWTVYKMGAGAPRCLALLNARTREEVQYEWLRHEASCWLEPSWDLDTYKSYREVVKNWVVQYIGESQSIVFAAELDVRRKEHLEFEQQNCFL